MTAQNARLRELGAFLRGRRGRLEPAEAGIGGSGPRRTSGLRREEVAEVAGVSLGYYVRLEQGRGGAPSAAVLDALARALRLDDDEQAHLHALADPGGNRRPTVVSAELLQQAHDVLGLLAPPSAAYVIDRVGDVLAWNAIAAELFVDNFPAGLDTAANRPGGVRPNNVRYAFLNPAARRLFPHWEEIADDAVAHLRAAIGYRPDDPALRALLADLGTRSPDFAQRWERRDVRPCHRGRKVFEHPTAGRLELDYRVLEIPATCHHRLVVYSAVEGSVDFRALARLCGRRTSGAGPVPSRRADTSA
ncbi:helix-turn-helix transcriptional regulator [Pseudonocardia xinjiangensis]|uniref:Helix-turn-helix domain-containing protein n=1 Tax=Pseudonocardia xinjiangensis TaxID=75289 RepID=A0ABX1RCL2_9PSEU|nr:helix-turn-helix transcriptional regulator [Pseudonocardia xinjiangensis]NMH76958.1 helix-turn-helix domain-containing protein [Pseudonocardia xinjiangensis]